jgi:hypothetical protein
MSRAKVEQNRAVGASVKVDELGLHLGTVCLSAHVRMPLERSWYGDSSVMGRMVRREGDEEEEEGGEIEVGVRD